MTAVDQAAVERTSKVIRWRRHVLLEAGYERLDARLIADRADIDLHTAVYLLKAGCPLETALRILL